MRRALFTIPSKKLTAVTGAPAVASRTACRPVPQLEVGDIELSNIAEQLSNARPFQEDERVLLVVVDFGPAVVTLASGKNLVGALGLEWAAECGARILEEEAKRIFSSSGVLREGSSHYHLLIARNYADAWLAARRHGRPEAAVLRDITSRAPAVVPWLILPGGMPLIGDVSPDCPPE